MKVQDKCVVSIHYTLTDNDGTELDSSKGREPLTYLHGTGSIIPGLEKALEGADEGENVNVVLEPDDAYGQVNDELVQTVPKEAFEEVEKVEPGMQFQARGPDGSTQRITVVGITEEGITVDGNHPLAGQTLNFDVTVEGVREATAEELQQVG
ncbi:MAG: peptidylprolyl isomerase [Pseudomonadales bacterium]|nr:peptidylprolyl isomerase [Pseudomonadales bacterium]